MKEEAESTSEQDPQLCGVHTAYVALRLLGTDGVRPEEILAYFPGIREKGVSLNELKLFFREKGYHCSIEKLTDLDVLRKDEKNIYIALQPFEKGNHLIVKQKLNGKQLQVINAPSSVQITSASDSHESFTALRISPESIPFDLATLFLPLGMLVFLVIGILSLKKCFRRKDVK